MDALEFVKIIDKDLTIVDFWAPWCGPCKTLSPILDSINEKDTELKILKVNVDESKELAAQFGIRSIPTMIFMKDEKEIDRISGVIPEPQLLKIIEKNRKE